MTLLPSRLYLRVILLVSAILCLTGVLSGWLTARRQSDSLGAAMWAHASIMSRNLSEECARFMVLQDFAGLETFLLKSAELPDIVALQVCEADGKVIGEVKKSGGGRPVSAQGITRIRPPAPRVEPTMIVRDGQLTVWQEISAGSLLGWLRADYSLASIRQAQAETWRQTLLVAVLWVFCSALLILLVLRPTALALGRLTAFARDLNECKGARVSVEHGSAEIADLEASLNYASEKLFTTEQLMIGDRERLRESEIMYRSLVTAMAEGVIFQGGAGEITALNPAAERILGFSAGELVGRVPDDRLLPAVHEDGTPFPAALHPALVTLDSGEPGYNVIMGLTRPDGTLVWISVNSQPLAVEGATRPSAVVTTFHDITERKRSEEELLHLAAMVEYSDDAIIGKSLDGIILSWNRGAEHLFGYGEFEARGRSVAMLFPEDRQTELAWILDRVRRGAPVEHLETVRLGKGGIPVEVSVTISPLLDRAGRIVGASTITRDISERKKGEAELRNAYGELERRVAERTADLNARSNELADSQRALMNIVEDLNKKTEELEEANAKLKELDRLKSMFVASMSHELRTPLNSIIGFSSVILNEWLGPVTAEQKENLAIILRSGKHLLNLINDVIDVSKIEAGKIESMAEGFDLGALLDEAITLIRKDAADKGLEVEVRGAPLSMHTDRRRLLQCVLNLLSNAVKFTEKGCVTLEIRTPSATARAPGDAAVEIAVTDTGVGIRGEDLPRMFQPFVRLVNPGQATVPGTGLGLYLTRKLVVEILKGELLLTSEYGQGSRFLLRIPVRLP